MNNKREMVWAAVEGFKKSNGVSNEFNYKFKEGEVLAYFNVIKNTIKNELLCIYFNNETEVKVVEINGKLIKVIENEFDRIIKSLDNYLFSFYYDKLFGEEEE